MFAGGEYKSKVTFIILDKELRFYHWNMPFQNRVLWIIKKLVDKGVAQKYFVFSF